MRNAMIIDAKDNVAVAIEPIAKGDAAVYVCEGKEVSLPALEDITIYHKLATRDIAKGEPVVKYGEHIGVASSDIRPVSTSTSTTWRATGKTWKRKSKEETRHDFLRL